MVGPEEILVVFAALKAVLEFPASIEKFRNWWRARQRAKRRERK